MRSKPFDESMAEVFRGDPELALSLLNEVLQENALEELPGLLRQIELAFGDGGEQQAMHNSQPACPSIEMLMHAASKLGHRVSLAPYS